MRVTNADVAQPGFDLDPTNANAPLFFYGVKPLDASAAPWSNAPIFSRYFDRATVREYIKQDGSTWLIADRPAQRTLYVGAGAHYTTLSAALAAITDASDSNEYLLVVSGEIAETAAITAKSHVHVFFLPGASVTITSTATANGVNMPSLVNCVWAAADAARANIIRAGVVGGAVYGLYTTGCNATVILQNLTVLNSTTGAASSHGIYNNTSSSPTMLGCTATGGAGGNTCYGIYNNSSSSPIMTNCAGVGGPAGSTCVGIYNNNGSNPVMTNCTATGGSNSGSTACYGVLNSNASPTMINLVAVGGSGGASCHGVYNSSGSNPVMTNCTATGGAGGATCYGIFNNTGVVSMTNCVGIGGSGGATGYGIYNLSAQVAMTNCAGVGGNGGINAFGSFNATSARVYAVNCRFIGGGVGQTRGTATIAASSRQEDAFAPGALPFRIVGVSINVTAAAAAGVTLTLRDATGGGGNALSAAVAVDSNGAKYFPITGHRLIAAGSSVYAYLSAVDATLAYTITFAYETCHATCYALSQDADTASVFLDCSYLSNAASPTIYISNNGDDRSLFDGGSARSGLNDAGRQKAFVCQSAWNPASVYNMVLAGGSTNLTCAAGTANGTCVEV